MPGPDAESFLSVMGELDSASGSFMMYRSTEHRCRRGAPMKNPAHSASRIRRTSRIKTWIKRLASVARNLGVALPKLIEPAATPVVRARARCKKLNVRQKAGTGSRDGFDGNTEAGLCLMPLNRLLRTLISKAGASLSLLDGCRIAMELAPFDHRRSSAGSIIAVQCLTWISRGKLVRVSQPSAVTRMVSLTSIPQPSIHMPRIE